MGHSGKEMSYFFFSQFPCVVEQNVKLLDSVHPNKIPYSLSSMWNFSSKLATNETWVDIVEESYFMFFSWVFLIIIACILPFTLSFIRHPSPPPQIHPTRGHRSHKTYRNRKSNFLSPLQNTETYFLYTSQIGKALSQQIQCGSSCWKHLKDCISQFHMSFLASNYWDEESKAIYPAF